MECTTKYKRLENITFKKNILKEKHFIISINLEVNYQSYGGKVDESRYGKRNFEQALEVYNEWKNGKKYSETVKQERKIMNDDIRYNVLKRDNYTCQICGRSKKDGAKLHVDHIMPVSKGGHTVMNNLQTLCDRCNLGKSNKTDDDFNMMCPKCGKTLVKRKGKYGEFFGCSGYPKCKYIKKESRGE